MTTPPPSLTPFARPTPVVAATNTSRGTVCNVALKCMSETS